MLFFSGENINDLYFDCLQSCLKACSKTNNSRCGEVYDFGPAYFEFLDPQDQLLTLKNRGYNPYFAIIEAAWIIHGSNQLAPLESVISDYSKYSDDGITLNGAYGFRMRNYFGEDQLKQAITLLKKEPNTRRAVITLYAPNDLIKNSKDIPCNTTIYIKIRDEKLDLTVLNRSNDLFLGIPYNVFVFNCLQKYIANQLELKPGVQRHFTDSLHLYRENFERVKNVIQKNSKEEISCWSETTHPNQLYSCIINESEAICKLRPESVNCSYTRELLTNYLCYMNHKNHIDLEKSLPYDTFGLSATLWLDSKKSK